jgi:hypothetical protein
MAAAPGLLSSSITKLRKLFFTADDLKDPSRLYQLLILMQSSTVNAFESLKSNPTLHGVSLSATFTAGQTLNLKHGLGRPWVGYQVTRAQTNPWQGIDTVYPVGTSASLILPLKSTNAGTYQFWIT